jgi:hypothetical protein
MSEKLNFTIYSEVGFVSSDGSYGVDEVIVFDPNLLTDDQWEMVNDELGDTDRIGYIEACLNGKEAEWLQENAEWLQENEEEED